MDVHAPELEWLVSVDDHVIEPPNVWVDRAPSKWRDDVPRLVDDAWVYDGKKVGTSGLSVTIGKRKEEFTPNPVPYSEMPEAAYDPVAARSASRRSRASAGRCSGKRPTRSSRCTACSPTTTG